MVYLWTKRRSRKWRNITYLTLKNYFEVEQHLSWSRNTNIRRPKTAYCGFCLFVFFIFLVSVVFLESVEDCFTLILHVKFKMRARLECWWSYSLLQIAWDPSMPLFCLMPPAVHVDNTNHLNPRFSKWKRILFFSFLNVNQIHCSCFLIFFTFQHVQHCLHNVLWMVTKSCASWLMVYQYYPPLNWHTLCQIGFGWICGY